MFDVRVEDHLQPGQMCALPEPIAGVSCGYNAAALEAADARRKDVLLEASRRPAQPGSGGESLVLRIRRRHRFTLFRIPNPRAVASSGSVRAPTAHPQRFGKTRLSRIEPHQGPT